MKTGFGESGLLLPPGTDISSPSPELVLPDRAGQLIPATESDIAELSATPQYANGLHAFGIVPDQPLRPSRLTDELIGHLAENYPPDVAYDQAITLLMNELCEHPFIQGSLADPVTTTPRQALAWGGAAKTESWTFLLMLRASQKRLETESDSELVQVVLPENEDDESGSPKLGIPHNTHRDHYLDVERVIEKGVDGVGHHIFTMYEQKEGVMLAARLARHIGKVADLFELAGYMGYNETATGLTYPAAQRALSAYCADIPEWFFQLHGEVDERHSQLIRDGFLKAVRASATPVEDTKTTLRGAREASVVGMLPLLDEVMAADKPVMHDRPDLSGLYTPRLKAAP